MSIAIIKCIIEIKQGVWWVQSPESMGGYNLYSTKGLASTCTTSEAIGRLVY